MNFYPTGPVMTDEDTPLVFSTVNGNAISVADVDAGSGELEVTLSVDNGTITLGSTFVTITAGSNGSDFVTIRGTLTAINAALEGTTYSPNANFNGTDTFSMLTDDLGNTGAGGAQTDSDSFSITVNAVNDAPVAVDDSYSTDEDTPLNEAAPGVLGNDTDVDNVSLSAVLVSGPSNGALTLNARRQLQLHAGPQLQRLGLVHLQGQRRRRLTPTWPRCRSPSTRSTTLPSRSTTPTRPTRTRL